MFKLLKLFFSFVAILLISGSVTVSVHAEDLTETLDRAVENSVALGVGVFPGCTVSRVQNDGATTIVACARDIIRAVFVVAILIVVVQLVTSNLGVILKSGEGATPVQDAKEKITNALIGLFLIGGIWTILSLFSGGFNLRLERIEGIANPAESHFYALNTAQQYSDNNPRYADVSRKDLVFDDTDIATNLDTASLGNFIETYITQSGVNTILVSGETYVRASEKGIPLKYLIALAEVDSRFGTVSCAATTKAIIQPCEKNYSTYEEGLLQFATHYSSNAAQYEHCERWDKYAPKDKESSYCQDIFNSSNRFESTLQAAIDIEKIQ